MRIVYDASARANEKVPSLNDCLETGPTLQSKLPSVLIRNRSQPVALAGDLKQAFLPVRMREKDRDVMRLHWIKDLAIKKSGKLTFHDGTIRFVHPSGSGRWGAVIDQHLDNLQHIYPNEVEEIRRSLYVDDLIGGERSVADARHLRQALQSIFRAG